MELLAQKWTYTTSKFRQNEPSDKALPIFLFRRWPFSITLKGFLKNSNPLQNYSHLHYIPCTYIRQFRQLSLCEDVIKSELVYTVLMRLKSRPKHVTAVTQRHDKNHLFITMYIWGGGGGGGGKPTKKNGKNLKTLKNSKIIKNPNKVTQTTKK